MHFHLIEDYKKIGFSKGLISLWSGKLFLDFGLNVVGLFLPIFLYQELGSVNLVILWWLVGCLGYALIAPVGAKLMQIIGVKNSMIIAVLLRIPYFYALYNLADNPLLYGLISALVLVAIRSFFWLPFQVDSAKFSSKKNRGKQFSIIFSISSLLSIIAPIIGGLVIDKWNFSVLWILATFLVVISIIPFFYLPKTKEEMSWSYKETFKYFIHPFNRRMVVAYMSDGAVGVINTIFWPLFIFTILDERFTAVGLLTGAILFAGVVIRLIMGQLLDKFQKIKLVRLGTVLNSTAWLIKIAVTSAFHIFLSSIYHTIATIVLRTSLDTLVYEKAADAGHYIDEYTLIKEMAINFGKVIALLVVALLLLFFPLQVSFILAAILALFVSLLK